MRRISYKYCAIAGVLLLCLLTPSRAHAQSSSEHNGRTLDIPPCGFEHPLDSALAYCMEVLQPGTTAETMCILEFTDKWDAEMNRIYRELVSYEDAEMVEQLRISQRLWVKMRDAEFEFINLRYRDRKGTMYNQLIAWEKLDFVRDRCMELRRYRARDKADRE